MATTHWVISNISLLFSFSCTLKYCNCMHYIQALMVSRYTCDVSNHINFSGRFLWQEASYLGLKLYVSLTLHRARSISCRSLNFMLYGAPY